MSLSLEQPRLAPVRHFLGMTKGWFSKRVVLADVPRNENRNEGTFGCSPGTKAGTRVRSHVPPGTTRAHSLTAVIVL